jgi:hypothetical protein
MMDPSRVVYLSRGRHDGYSYSELGQGWRGVKTRSKLEWVNRVRSRIPPKSPRWVVPRMAELYRVGIRYTKEPHLAIDQPV